MAYPQSIALHPQFSILNVLFFILLPQISLIQPFFAIFNSSSSTPCQKNGILDSKSPQNSRISDKMSSSAAYTACSFFQVCLKCWLPVLKPLPSNLNFKFSILYSPSSYLKSPLSNIESPSWTLLSQSPAKSIWYSTENALKMAGFPTKRSASAACVACNLPGLRYRIVMLWFLKIYQFGAGPSFLPYP